MISRTRVVPPFSSKGWLSMGLFIGSAISAAMILGSPLLFEFDWRGYTTLRVSVEIVLVVGMGAALVACACMVVQRPGPIALLGAVAGFTIVVINIGYHVLARDDGGAGGALPLLRLVVLLVGCTASATVVALATLGLIRAVGVFNIRHRDSPTSCWGCAYELTEDHRIPVCPECARPRSLPPPRWFVSDAWRWVQRYGRIPAIGLILLGFSWFVFRIVVVVLPTRDFRASLDPEGRARLSLFTVIPGFEDASTAWQPMEGHDDRVLLYSFLPRPARGLPVMRIALVAADTKSLLATPIPPPNSVHYLGVPDVGTSLVCADLDSAQASRVISAGGASEALRLALLERAATVKWRAAGRAPVVDRPIERIEVAP